MAFSCGRWFKKKQEVAFIFLFAALTLDTISLLLRKHFFVHSEVILKTTNKTKQ